MRNRRFNRLTFVLLAVTFNMSQVSAEDRPKFLVLELDIDFTNGTSCRKDDSTSYYIVVPKSWAGTQVRGRIRITYVLADPPSVVRLTEEGVCMAHNTCVFLCRNSNCTRDAQGPACNPDDKRTDRWLAHKWESCTQ